MRRFIGDLASVALATIILTAGAAYAQPGNGNANGMETGEVRKARATQQSGANDAPPKEQINRGQTDRGNANKSASKADNTTNERANRGRANSRNREAAGTEGKGRRKTDEGHEIARVNGSLNASRETGADRDDFRDFDRRAVSPKRVATLPRERNRGLIDGCPPGLAKKGTGCVPPGLANEGANDRNGYHAPDFFGYDRVSGGRYYYGDGYLYRLGSDSSVLGFLPLLGGALGVGSQWPSYYGGAELPLYHRDYYNLGSGDSYGYADDVIYRLDPETSTITSIAALLTGDRFTIGEPMPRGYDVYNVPYAFRNRYPEGPDALYRYADGYIYRIDPQTRLVAAAIELLA